MLSRGNEVEEEEGREIASTSAGIPSRIGEIEPGISMPLKSISPISSSNAANKSLSMVSGIAVVASGDT